MITIDDRDDDSDDANDPKFVTALSRGLAILRAYRSDETYLSNHEFASRVGLPKTTVTRLTYTLCKLGYLVQAAPGGEYRLGPGVLTLGYGALARTDLKDRAQLELADICRGDNPNVAAALGERYGQAIVYLATYRSPKSVSMIFHLGAQVPLFHSSIGRATLMAMPEDKQNELMDQAQRLAKPEDRDRIKRGLTRAREDFDRYGFCTSFGEWREEINGIAAPVISEQGDSIHAVNVGGFSFLNPKEDLLTIFAPRLLRAARALALKPENHD